MSETYKQDQVLDHDYDGIQEYDNRLPNWWLATLYGSILFAFGYWMYVHTFGAAPTPAEHYEAEVVAAAEAQLARNAGQKMTNASLGLMATIPAKLEGGRRVFEQFCVVCHSEQGQGNVGPNLTDAYWLHGSLPLDIYDVIWNGVTDKGMAAWGNQLGPRRVEEVVAYVLSIKNTDVPGKEPQGDEVTAEQEAALLQAAAEADSIAAAEAEADSASVAEGAAPEEGGSEP